MLTQLQKDSIIITKLICLLAEIYQLFVMPHDFAHNTFLWWRRIQEKPIDLTILRSFFSLFYFYCYCVYMIDILQAIWWFVHPEANHYNSIYRQIFNLTKQLKNFKTNTLRELNKSKIVQN